MPIKSVCVKAECLHLHLPVACDWLLSVSPLFYGPKIFNKNWLKDLLFDKEVSVALWSLSLFMNDPYELSFGDSR